MLEKNIAALLQNHQLKLSDSKKLADSILKLSDFYIQNPMAETPWNEKWCQVAYISYFFPLNYFRAQRVMNHLEKLKFFSEIKSVIDFGSGLGSASLALQEIHPKMQFKFIETSPKAADLHRQYWPQNSHWKNTYQKEDRADLVIFSYSLTELKAPPSWVFDFPNILIIEPATHQDARLLMKNREIFLNKAYHIWAPCTHHKECPLLKHSKTDWCHDRVITPHLPWLKEIEKHLPMKNASLTMSYLTVSKKQPPAMTQKSRLVGDQLVEKGKTRQLICNSDERVFLSWMKKDKTPIPDISRGDLIELASFEMVSNELRKPVLK